MPWDNDDRGKFQNDLINQRLTWLGTFEGLLFVANHYAEHPYLLPLVGFVIAVSVGVGIHSANCEITKLRAQAFSGPVNLLMPGTTIPIVIAFAWAVIFLENFKREGSMATSIVLAAVTALLAVGTWFLKIFLYERYEFKETIVGQPIGAYVMIRLDRLTGRVHGFNWAGWVKIQPHSGYPGTEKPEG